jgi:hypothetical protein
VNQSPQFNPTSTDALLATLIANQQAEQKSREEFRAEVRERFDRGSERMDRQDAILKGILEQATRTNGRVTRLEDGDTTRRLDMLEAAEISTRADIIRAKTALWLIGGIIGVLQAVGLTLLNYFLAGR